MLAVYVVIPDEDTAPAEAGAAAALMVQSRLHPDSVEAHLVIVVRAVDVLAPVVGAVYETHATLGLSRVSTTTARRQLDATAATAVAGVQLAMRAVLAKSQRGGF